MKFSDVPVNARWALNRENDVLVAEFDGNSVRFWPGKTESGPVAPMRPLTDIERSWREPILREVAESMLTGADAK